MVISSIPQYSTTITKTPSKLDLRASREAFGDRCEHFGKTVMKILWELYKLYSENLLDSEGKNDRRYMHGYLRVLKLL